MKNWTSYFDPYQIAREQGLSVDGEWLHDKNDRLGFIDLSNQHVVINNAVDFEPRNRFSVAHELGHAVLHTQIVRRLYEEFPAAADDLKEPNSRLCQIIERQANYFAGCLLMPTFTIEQLYKECHHRFFDGKVRPIYANISLEKHRIYYNMVRAIANYMNTSVDATKRRLFELGLIKDRWF